MTLGYNVSYRSVNYSLNYSWSKTPYYNDADQVVAFTIQIPFDRFLPDSWLNLSGSTTNHDNSTASAGLSGSALADNNLNYSVYQGYTSQGSGVSGNASLDYKVRNGEYQAGYNYTGHTRQFNYSAMGGIVIHPYGVTLSQPMGDTLALVKADKADHVRLKNNTGVYTDNAGYAIVPYVTPYRRNLLSLDTNALSDNVDILSDTRTVVPTQGALVLAQYPTRSGKKIMLNLITTQPVPFGAKASVSNDQQISQGIVDDYQRVYLSGAPEEGVVEVTWGSGSCLAPYRADIDSSASVNLVSVKCQ